MAQVAARLSDYVMVTSDNPRTENPEQIIKDILQGFSLESIPQFQKSQEKILPAQADRKRAIEQVIRSARPEDIILIARQGPRRLSNLSRKNAIRRFQNRTIGFVKLIKF